VIKNTKGDTLIDSNNNPLYTCSMCGTKGTPVMNTASTPATTLVNYAGDAIVSCNIPTTIYQY